MNFLDNFIGRCQARGESPSHALEAAGLSKSVLTRWRDRPNSVPTGETITKLANYFGCTFEDLLYGGPVRVRSETALKIQAAVDKLNEQDQAYLLRFIEFMWGEKI